MHAPFRQPWTQERFFAWAEAQEERYEFDGAQPVAMTGENVGHSLVFGNLYAALRARLRGGPCRPLGPGAGLETINQAIRYPDVLVTCAPIDSAARLVHNVVAVFEVLSPTSGHIDRIVKVREYAAVASVRRYVILETASIGLTVLAREAADETWRTTVLTAEDTLSLPELDVSIPVPELYEGLTFQDQDS